MKNRINNSKLLNHILGVCVLIITTASQAFADDYYWKINSNNGNWNNINNWAIGSPLGSQPGTAPGISDNVFFTGSPLHNSITLPVNGGLCHNLTIQTVDDIELLGRLEIAGDLISNGKGFFKGTGLLTFSSSNPTTLIDLGTDDQRIFKNILINGLGTNFTFNRNLVLGFNTIEFREGSVVIIGKEIQAARVLFNSGVSGKFINFSNSTLNINNNTTNMSIVLNSNSTVYNFSGVQINLTGTHRNGFECRVNTVLNGLSTVTFSGNAKSGFAIGQCEFTIGLAELVVNVPHLEFWSALGQSFSSLHTVNINTNKLVINTPTLIEQLHSQAKITLNEVESNTGCGSISKFISSSPNRLEVNSLTPNLAIDNVYFNKIQFGGSGFAIEEHYDLGGNQGNVTWIGTSETTKNFYWRGGTGNWNNPSQWDVGAPLAGNPGNCLPTLIDNVLFDSANSGLNSSSTVTIIGHGNCQNITWSGTPQGTITGGELTVNGSADFSACNAVNVSKITFVGSGTHTLTSGTQLSAYQSPIFFTGKGSYSIMDQLISAFPIFHYSGVLNTNNNMLRIARFVSVSNPSDLERELYAGSSRIELLNGGGSSSTGAWFLNTSNLVNCDLSNTSTILFGNDAQHTSSGFSSTIPSLVYGDIEFKQDGNLVLNSTFSMNSVYYGHVTFIQNGNISTNSNPVGQIHQVKSYNINTGFTYKFTGNSNRIFTTENGIFNSTGFCSDLSRLMSSSSINAKIQCLANPFEVYNLSIGNIEVVGATMEVMNGSEFSPNINVNVSITPPLSFYWRPSNVAGNQGSGNWNDGKHWAIDDGNAPFIDPATTNSSGCLPRQIDNVFFDEYSFATNNQTVTIDLEASCNNMNWNLVSGSYNPILAGSAKLNIFGSIKLSAGINANLYDGDIYMNGVNTVINSQFVDCDGVTFDNARIFFDGNGRYDLRSNITFKNTANHSVRLLKGKLYTNGFDVHAFRAFFEIEGDNYLDMSNSNIHIWGNANAYIAEHDKLNNFDANNSTIHLYANGAVLIYLLDGSANTQYNTIHHHNYTVGGYENKYVTVHSGTNHTLRVNTIRFDTPFSGLSGNIYTTNLLYRKSSENVLNPRNGLTPYTYQIDNLIAIGSPCDKIQLKSTIPVHAKVESISGNPLIVENGDINYLEGIGLSTYQVIGSGANYINWIVSPIDTLTLLSDTLVSCDELPLTLDVSHFGLGASYVWNTGDTGPIIAIDTAGTYSVIVDYGDGCVFNSSINVEVDDFEKPEVTCPSDVTFSADIDECTYTIKDTALDALVTDNCEVNKIWLDFTGSTVSTSSDTTSTMLGYEFNLGVTQVSWSANDFGIIPNDSTCTFTITVIDDQDPVIQCPDPMDDPDTLYTNNALCSYTHTGTGLDLDADDNCAIATITYDLTGATTTNVASSLNGVVFGLGLTTIFMEVTDSSANTSTCTFSIVVVDGDKPHIANCPTDQTVYVPQASCTHTHASTSWDLVTLDNCGVVSEEWELTGATEAIGINSLNNVIFNIGVTTVTWTIKDAAENDSTCIFEVLVLDTISPNLSCQPDAEKPADLDQCDYTHPDDTWDATAIDNCSDVTILYTLTGATEDEDLTTLEGVTFNLGTTLVTVVAKDSSENESICFFEVKIVDEQNPEITCPDNDTVYVNMNVCTYTVPDDRYDPVMTDNCTVTNLFYEISGATSSTGTVTIMGESLNLGLNYIEYIVKDTAENEATCIFEILVLDNQNPVITCLPDQVFNTDSGLCHYTADNLLNPVSYGDNCSVQLPTYSVVDSLNIVIGSGISNLSGFEFPLGESSVTWYIEDGSGNKDSCSFTVTVIDNEFPVISNCPSDMLVVDNIVDCEVAVTWVEPTASDNCSLSSFTSDYLPGSIFPSGHTTVTYTAVDGSGNDTQCAFTISVLDEVDPVIAGCPSTITVANDAGLCGATVTWQEPIATDNCGVESFISNMNSGEFYSVGTHIIFYTATDIYGNTSTCEFSIIVSDNESPIITAIPETIIGCLNQPVFWDELIASDNCELISFGTTTPPGTVFPLGTTTVLYEAQDASGNTSSVSFNVIVNPLPEILISSDLVNACIGEDVLLSVQNPNENYDYEWIGSDGEFLGYGTTYSMSNVDLIHTSQYVLTATDENGCATSVGVNLQVSPCGITITQAMTPDGDGYNDVFVIENVDLYPNTKIKIFNRWGAKVYEDDDYANNWDGRSEHALTAGNGLLPEGTYFYLIELGGDPQSPDYGKIYQSYFVIKH